MCMAMGENMGGNSVSNHFYLGLSKHRHLSVIGAAESRRGYTWAVLLIQPLTARPKTATSHGAGGFARRY